MTTAAEITDERPTKISGQQSQLASQMAGTEASALVDKTAEAVGSKGEDSMSDVCPKTGMMILRGPLSHYRAQHPSGSPSSPWTAQPPGTLSFHEPEGSDPMALWRYRHRLLDSIASLQQGSKPAGVRRLAYFPAQGGYIKVSTAAGFAKDFSLPSHSPTGNSQITDNDVSRVLTELAVKWDGIPLDIHSVDLAWPHRRVADLQGDVSIHGTAASALRFVPALNECWDQGREIDYDRWLETDADRSPRKIQDGCKYSFVLRPQKSLFSGELRRAKTGNGHDGEYVTLDDAWAYSILGKSLAQIRETADKAGAKIQPFSVSCMDMSEEQRSRSVQAFKSAFWGRYPQASADSCSFDESPVEGA